MDMKYNSARKVAAQTQATDTTQVWAIETLVKEVLFHKGFSSTLTAEFLSRFTGSKHSADLSHLIATVGWHLEKPQSSYWELQQRFSTWQGHTSPLLSPPISF